MNNRPHTLFNFHADTPSAYREAAKERRVSKDYDGAERILREGVEHFPEDARLWSELGKRLARSGDFERDDEAMECLEKSYALQSDDPLIASDYAAFLFKKGYTQESEITYLRAFDDENQANWKNVRVLCGLGDIYQKMGNYEYSVACFGRAYEFGIDDEVAARRFAEVVFKSHLTYTEEGWTQYMDYAQDLIDEAGPAPETLGPKPTP